jgi:hypothetical protein
VERLLHDIAEGRTRARVKTKPRGLARVTGGKTAANRSVGLLGAIFAYAVRLGMRAAASGIGRQRQPPVDDALLASRPFREFLCRRCHSRDPHKRSAGDTHTRDLGRCRPAVADLPMRQKRFGQALRVTFAQ